MEALNIALWPNHRFKIKQTHLPVSPLVAPTTVSFSRFSPTLFLLFLRTKKNSKRFPSNCRATSLNAKVGPWNSSRTYVLSLSFLSGVMSGWRKVLYDLSTKVRSSSREISEGEI